jgi:hypothetical protein
MVTLNCGNGRSKPGTLTSVCAMGRKLGGNSRSPAWVLKEETTSQRTGPNIRTTPRRR